MQIRNPFVGSIQRYFQEISDPGCFRPDHCPQCEARRPLTAHGFYSRTLVDAAFDGTIRVRRYPCGCCKRAVSLLPEFALPYLRFAIQVISLFYGEAKKTVAGILSDFGWGVVDIGGIESSRYLEAMCLVWVLHGARTNTWDHALKLLRS